ncbi:MAG: 4-amino-4-deoxy-L-arabinose-phosphoundecaprenol flippase subunit ArnE [Candidatus Woesearchaeota archaeon]|nr:4-amino-4-deoxy-L-arabinose-phosphoundecaprenol flippase subunit ArnE [Candidatus Woesearchaeota archaeon]
MKTKPWAIALVIFFTFLTSVAQILYKMAALRLEFSFIGLITNWPLILGGVLYLVSAALMVISFKGGELSVLYPLIALSYVWVSLISPKVFPTDSISKLKWAGIAIIIIGVSLIGVGSQK